MAFSTNFCPVKSDISGNTVWPQASDILKLTLARDGTFLVIFQHRGLLLCSSMLLSEERVECKRKWNLG